MKTTEILEQAGLYARSKPFASYAAKTRWVKAQLELAGEFPIKALYTKGGNCRICGEAGRCPGWHTKDDLPPPEGFFI